MCTEKLVLTSNAICTVQEFFIVLVVSEYQRREEQQGKENSGS